MAKPRKEFRVRLPLYVSPHMAWRRKILDAIREAQHRTPVTYLASDRLELSVLFYMKNRVAEIHDVDNRLKDVMDALQGRMGGSKSIKPHAPVIHNDRQVWRVAVEKKEPPKQSQDGGYLTVRRLKFRELSRKRTQ